MINELSGFISFILLLTLSVSGKTNAQSVQLIDGYPLTRFFQNGIDFEGTDLTYGIIEDADGTILFGNDMIGVQQITGTQSRQILYPRQAVASSFAKDFNGRIYSTANGAFGYLKHDDSGAYVFQPLMHLIQESDHSVPFLHKVTPSGDSGDMLFVGQDQAYLYHAAQYGVSILTPTGRFYDALHLNGRTWVTDTASGLHLLGTDGQLTPVLTPFPAAENRILSVNGELAVYTIDHELWLLDEGRYWLKSGVFEYYKDKDRLHVLSATTLADNTIIITSLSGVQIFEADGTLLHNFNSSNILPFDIAGQAFEASDGTIWVSSPSGLAAIMYSSPHRQFISAQGIPDNRIWSTAEWMNRIMVGTDRGLWVGDENGFTQVFSNIAVFDFEISSRGLLAGTTSGLILIAEDFQIQKLTDDLFVRSVFSDPHHPETFYFFDSPNQLSRLVFRDEGSVAEITPLHPFSFMPEAFVKVSDTEFLISTGTNGIFRFTGTADAYGMAAVTEKSLVGERYGLSDDGSASLMSYRGDVAFLTDSGVRRFNEARSGLEPHPDFDFFDPSRWPRLRLMQSVSGNDMNLAGYGNPSFFPFIQREEEGGTAVLKNLPFSWAEHGEPRALNPGASGRLYKISPGSVSYLETGWQNLVQAETPPPRLLLTGVNALPDSVLHPGWQMGAIAGMNRISWSNNSLRFSWSLVSFSPAGLNRYQFRLRGADTEWSVWTSETIADYRNLREGSYEFQVRGRNEHGQLSDVVTVAFAIAPPWFRSRIAYLLYMIGLAAIAFGALSWRTRTLIARQAELEAQVEERTKLIQQKNIQLEKLNQVKTRFFSGISHEFRTPLTLIKGPAELLKLSGNTVTEEERIYSADLIITNADRLLSMVNEILNLSKMESGTFRSEVEAAVLADILQETVNWYKPLAAQKKLQFTLEIAPELLQKEGFFDKRQMELLISNLISNAVKYTQRGSVHIKLNAGTDGDGFMLEISDTGIGISKEELPLIFNRFFRSSAASLFEGGTGIGLSLVQHIAEIHGMRLEVDSETGAGTRIKAFIPGSLEAFKGDYVLVKKDVSETEGFRGGHVCTPHVPPSDLSVHADSQKLNALPDPDSDVPVVMIVDDNSGIRNFIRQVLSDSYQFAECGNGLEALEMARKVLPDIILSDVMMPLMDGVSLTQQLRQFSETRHIPVILITAKGSENSELAGLEAGANDYITKPFSPAILKARVEGQLGLQKELRRFIKKQHTGSKPPTAAVKGTGRTDAANLSFGDKVSVKQNDYLKEAEDIIKENFGNPDFSVEFLAMRMNMSRSSLNRKFKHHSNETAQDMIKRMRLEEALRLFEQGEDSITQVAYAVGYNSLSYFSRAFKEHFGANPSEFIVKK